MRIRNAAVAAALALAASGCNDDTCPTETPVVEELGSCEAGAGALVSYPVRLCPTCDQVISSCDVEIQGNAIFLDPKVETCDPTNSCGPACEANPSTCNFTAPAATGSYSVSVYDPGRAATISGTLQVVAAGTPVSCGFATASR